MSAPQPITALDRCYDCQKRIGQKPWTLMEGHPVHKACADRRIYRTLGGFEGVVSYIMGAVILELRGRGWEQEDLAKFVEAVRGRMSGRSPDAEGSGKTQDG